MTVWKVSVALSTRRSLSRRPPATTTASSAVIFRPTRPAATAATHTATPDEEVPRKWSS